MTFFTGSILTFRGLLEDIRGKSDLANGGIAAAWTGLFFGRVLAYDGSAVAGGPRPWIRAVPVAFYSMLGTVLMDHLIQNHHDLKLGFEALKDFRTYSNIFSDEKRSIWWPRWFPGHPETRRQIGQLTAELKRLNEDLRAHLNSM